MTWADDLAADKALVLHIGAGRIGRVLRLWAPGVFVSPENGQAVTAPVIQLDTGDAFLANEENEQLFHRLTPAEAGTLEAFDHILRGVLTMTVQSAAARGVDPHMGALLLRVCLQQAAQALKEPNEQPPEQPEPA